MKSVKSLPILCILLFFSNTNTIAQGNYEAWISLQCEKSEVDWDQKYYWLAATSCWDKLGVERNLAYKKADELMKRSRQLEKEIAATNYSHYYYIKNQFKLPQFRSKEECNKYKQKLINERDKARLEANSYKSKGAHACDPEYDHGFKASLCPQLKAQQQAYLLSKKIDKCNCDRIDYNKQESREQEFLAEIASINAEIAAINQLANNRNIIGSFAKSQKLCDRLRLLLGRQYFRTALQKIRKENPGFSFSITPLTEKVTRNYWIRMRNRANIAYRNALDAHRECVYNEGIQTWNKVEIPLRFFKATFDLVTNTQDLFSGNLWGSIDEIRNSFGYQDDIVQLGNLVGLEVVKAGEEAKDWKSYVGVVTGLMSAWDGYIKTYNLVVENYKQKDLLVANRESASQLITSNKKMLLEFDKYRAYIDANSSAIDCLNDKLMRIEFDNKTVQGDPKEITIWGTGLYDWDGEEYINMIKESGEDLKNYYIYCDDFKKAFQMAMDLANKDYMRIEGKLRNSGAMNSQIDDQLSYNRQNADWFEGESQRLFEQYYQYCEKPESQPPGDVIIVSTEVIPGVENQNVSPDKTLPWEVEYPEEENQRPPQNDPFEGSTSNTDKNNGGGHSTPLNSGNSWSAYSTGSQTAQIEKAIQGETASGKTPAGISVGNSETDVWYINDNPLGMTSWKLENYTGANALQNGITSYLKQGYFPMGISFTDQGALYVLYIKSQVKATAWQLAESPLNLPDVRADIQSWVNQSYVPCGITIYNGKYYTLLAKVPDAAVKNWALEGYENNKQAIRQEVEQKINSGMVPFGYLLEQGIVDLLYVGF